jgi:predicted HAD superfamily phosphohydrolase YqeG
VVGDDPHRDIGPALRAGVKVAILVNPVGNKKFIGDKFTNRENRASRYLEKQGVIWPIPDEAP